MLPGFRFLFAAIVLSLSMLVFGLGAAALLRAAHEQFASAPPWHATPETMFAQQTEASKPVLAMLRVDMPAEQKISDDVPAPAEQTAIAATPAEPEKAAAPEPADSSPLETAKSESPVAETSPQVETAPVPADQPAPTDETKIATVVFPVAAPANDAPATAPEQSSAPASPEDAVASTKIATLGAQPVIIRPPAASAKPDRSAVRKRLQAERAKKRRRIAQRARLARQTFPQPADPFAQPTITVRSR